MHNPQGIQVGDVVYEVFVSQDIYKPRTYKEWNRSTVVFIHNNTAWLHYALERYDGPYRLCQLCYLYKEPHHAKL